MGVTTEQQFGLAPASSVPVLAQVMMRSMARGGTNLLTEIEAGAVDPTTDLPTLLRKCIALGGVTGSEGLRTWATLELKGYGSGDELPAYRHVTAPLLLDGVSGFNQIRGQQVPLLMLPAETRDILQMDVPFPQPVAEIADLLSAARANGESVVKLGPPGAAELVTLINHQLGKADKQRFPTSTLPPTQVVERVYWSVTLPPIARILDVVRTTLVELVAEMRVGTPDDDGLPSRDVAEQAVEIAVHGKRNRIVVNQLGTSTDGLVAGGPVSQGSAEVETPGRQIMWWMVGLATVATAIATVWLLFL